MLNEPVSALSHLREAQEVDPTAPELAHNVRKVLAESGLKRLNLSSDIESSFSSLYGELEKSVGTAAKASSGWRYMPPIAAKVDSPEEPDEPSSGSNFDQKPSLGKVPSVANKKSQSPGLAGVVFFASGTGFVIYPHFILTNHHVTEDATVFAISDPADPTGRTLRIAKVIAESRNPDLAILRCDELNASPVVIKSHLPGRGTDIMVLGFPKTSEYGEGLKSTRGSLSGLPDGDNEGMCLYDAKTNPGNSGGPVCDSTGRVIAVHRMGHKDAYSESLNGGIPCDEVVPYLQKHIPEFLPATNDGKILDWPAVDALVSKSTVLIKCGVERDSRLSVPGDDNIAFQSNSKSAATKSGKRPSGSVRTEPTYIEDDCCIACKGTGKVHCPDCQNGTVASTQHVDVITQGLSIDKKIRVPCKTCNGTGLLPCPICHGSGIEP